MTTDLHTSLTVDADLASLRAIGPWLGQNLHNAGDQDVPDALSTVELAVQEICVNIVTYAYGVSYAYGGPSAAVIELSFAADEAHYTVTTTDVGIAYDPSTKPKVDLERPTIGGYGLFLTESLCERLDYERSDNRNVWTLSLIHI